MKKDIEFPVVEDIAVVVAREEDVQDAPWNVYLLNLKSKEVTGVLITSKGYGQHEGRNVKTSTLRHFFEKIGSKSYVKVEHFPDHLFSISNEFWVSFYEDGLLHDKKYIFVTGSVSDENLIHIPLLNRKGVMIK
ncbi:MAG: DUF4909 domain-containing protein [Flavobacteriales bacterium]|nr:DUF4909 domain-containing protein [Flavobacteriales bacterium]MCB9449555.1 DUF4909 domain-containing protein [Flavobacteriales bacterium]